MKQIKKRKKKTEGTETIHREDDLKKRHHEYPYRAKEGMVAMEQEQSQLKMVMQETKSFSKLKNMRSQNNSIESAEKFN